MTDTMERPSDRQALLAERQPWLLERLRPMRRALTAYFRPEVRGLERVPDDGPVLVVGNHSGGVLMPDAAALVDAWLDRFGTGRPLYMLGSDLPQAVPGLGALMRAFGVVPADHGNAHAALGSGADVLVYPGGDLEDCRDWNHRHCIEFAHHRGFVRLALRSGVPIVPVVTHGSHETLVIVNRGDRVARALHLDRLRINVMPVVLGLPFGLAPITTPYVPLPAKITSEVLEPIAWPLDPGAADDDDIVERCYAEVVATMQAALDRLAEVPALPFGDPPGHPPLSA
jgi:1-acyl-sn-glycerol-3-phosphate acyltransferase